jgi:hypothetical protein
MNNIEQYKNRFFNLMESTIGDVRPLITEQINPDNIKEYKAKFIISKSLKKEDSKKMYKDAIDKNTKISGTEDEGVLNAYRSLVSQNNLDYVLRMYDEEFPSSGGNTTTSVPTGTGEGLSQSTITTVDDLGSIIRQSNKDKIADNFCKTESGYDICLVKKNMDKSTMDKMYSNAVRRIEGAGYTKVKETETNTDTNKNYIKRSTWKKA